MARRRLWRNDVVRSYWRTRHPLLRFLCLHEAVTLPFVVAISDPTYLLRSPSALRRLPQWNFVLLTVKCHGISPLSTAVRAIHRLALEGFPVVVSCLSCPGGLFCPVCLALEGFLVLSVWPWRAFLSCLSGPGGLSCRVLYCPVCLALEGSWYPLTSPWKFWGGVVGFRL